MLYVFLPIKMIYLCAPAQGEYKYRFPGSAVQQCTELFSCQRVQNNTATDRSIAVLFDLSESNGALVYGNLTHPAEFVFNAAHLNAGQGII